jgi:UDP-N-acetylenolpyruvoylglucosamine reductase
MQSVDDKIFRSMRMKNNSAAKYRDDPIVPARAGSIFSLPLNAPANASAEITRAPVKQVRERVVSHFGEPIRWNH